ncbi:unnamed protein product [Mytilus coruscus]|uniref:Uncharacterized protein n=1 Tax=Mytilus coruscus TaxID=42192 RepID=A0A6J8CGW6_MYTCO|nr:unnamed protein product [Mytilus coruscus]
MLRNFELLFIRTNGGRKQLAKDQGHMVQQLQEQAVLEHASFLVFLWIPHPVSNSLFFPVHAERRRYWSKSKRTNVTFDTVKKYFESCRCSSGKRTYHHKLATRWHICQQHKDMLASDIKHLNDSEENESENVILTDEDTENERKLDYIQRHKTVSS